MSNILEKYFAAARAARDGEFFVQCRQRKPYLTREVVERWGIGRAPTLKQCLAVGGLADAELSAAGLLRQGEHGGAWMHFRDSMVFPYREGDRTVYVSSRRLVDHDPKTGEPLPKEKKTLSAVSPDANGFGGLERPAGFNLDALKAEPARVLLVEGALDAIACCERGHPAIAYLGGSIRADLAKMLRDRFPSGEGVFVVPDATKDVTPRKRAELAATVGPRARVVLLPEGWDPDDVENSGDYEGPSWDELMQRAPDALTCWIGLFEGDPDAWPADLSEAFRKVVNEWIDWTVEAKDAATEDWVRREVRESLGLSYQGFAEWLAPKGRRETVAEAFPEATFEPIEAKDFKPLPPVPALSYDGGPSNLPVIRNWKLEERPTSKGPKLMRIALDLEEVLPQMLGVLHGWPARIHAPGAKTPLLFVHAEGCRSVIWMQDATDLESFLKRRAQLLFEPGKDFDGKNYATVANLYRSLGLETDVREFRSVEYFPHEPPLPGHYYVTAPAAKRKRPGGEALLEYVCQFENAEDEASKVVLVAAVLGMYWGGPYGQRPIIVCEAKKRGSGKSSFAKKTSGLVGGYIKANLGNPRDETEMMQRLLSPRGLEKRALLWDNVDSAKVVKNAWLDSTVTDDEISGKRMFLGEASRPNTLCWWITINNARLSPDIARRSFAIRFAKPKYYPEWEETIVRFLDEASDEVAADAVEILKAPAPKMDWGKVEESFALWAAEVLGRAWGWLHARGMVQLGIRDVLESNDLWRHDRDDDISEATTLMHELLERVTIDRGYFTEDGEALSLLSMYDRAEPKIVLTRDEFIPTIKRQGESQPSMCDYIEKILNRPNVNSKWVGNVLAEHIEAGRMPGLAKGAFRRRQGWWIDRAAIAAYLEAWREARAEEDAAKQA